jgi:hypothetical protein
MISTGKERVETAADETKPDNAKKKEKKRERREDVSIHADRSR